MDGGMPFLKRKAKEKEQGQQDESKGKAQTLEDPWIGLSRDVWSPEGVIGEKVT